MTLDAEEKAELDRMIERLQRHVSDLRAANQYNAAAHVGDTVQRLLVWQQTCDVSP